MVLLGFSVLGSSVFASVESSEMRDAVKKLEKALKPAQGGTKKLRLPQPTIIHVNQLVIRQNAKHGTDEPPLTFRKGRSGKESKRAHEVTIHGPSKIVHSPHEPLPCGARVWIETFAKVTSR